MKKHNPMIKMFDLDIDKLKERCFQTEEEILKSSGCDIYERGKELAYGFKDNGSKVLAVAHMDTVLQSSTFAVAELEEETLIFCPHLDDRLGVYTILDFLPSLRIRTDILLTTDEERGQSTASVFQSPKNYNWIVEFDRKGTGAVLYQYTWDKTVSKYFKIEHGTYSDIRDLDELNCQAVNIGVGYYQEHTSRCHMSSKDYITQMVHFDKMFKVEHRTKYAFDAKASPKTAWGYNSYDYTWYDPYYSCYNPKSKEHSKPNSKAGVAYGVKDDEEKYAFCESCGELFWKGDVLEWEDGEFICPCCYCIIDMED